jgi:hypothetical protein
MLCLRSANFISRVSSSSVFLPINTKGVQAIINTFVALTFSTDNTVLWWDHWEDGYDLDVTQVNNRIFYTDTIVPRTQIWGDRNCSNGHRYMLNIGRQPNGTTCKDSDDVLMAGDSIVIRDLIGVPRNVAKIRFDGGDRVLTSFPITMTRVGYPSGAEQYFGGAGKCLNVCECHENGPVMDDANPGNQR